MSSHLLVHLRNNLRFEASRCPLEYSAAEVQKYHAQSCCIGNRNRLSLNLVTERHYMTKPKQNLMLNVFLTVHHELTIN